MVHRKRVLGLHGAGLGTPLGQRCIDQGSSLIEQLRSPEGDSIGRVDHHILEVQLYLVDKEPTRRQQVNRSMSPNDNDSWQTPPASVRLWRMPLPRRIALHCALPRSDRPRLHPS
jgi:hypothetical protein